MQFPGIAHWCKFHIVALLSILQCCLSFLSANLLSHEICDGETFEGRCESGQVMVLKSARYGRMRLGRCVKVDVGYLGCSSDVLSLFDGWCSGKASCSVLISNVNEELNSRRACIEELRSYMQIEFACIGVMTVPHGECRTHKMAELQATQATLSSDTTDRAGCGDRDIPWIIRVSPGQRVSISMTDFGWDPDKEFIGSARCQPYGFISEPDLGVNQTLCGGLTRERQIHQSSSNYVIMQIIPTRQRDLKSSFLISYTVVGCPDITPPPHAWYKRNGSTAVIGCEWSEHSWHLRCDDSTWVGVVGNCSSGAQATEDVPQSQWSMSPLLSVSLIIGLGVLVVALFCIALIGCVCILRSKHGENQGTQPVFQPTDQQQAFLYYPGRPVPNPSVVGTNVRPVVDGTLDQAKPTATDELIHIWETPLPTPNQDQSSTRVIDNPTTMSGRGTLQGPPQVYKDGSTMSRSDYSTDTYWAGTDRYFDNDLGWVTMPPKQ